LFDFCALQTILQNFYDGFIAFPSVDYGENICSISTQFSLNPPTTDHQQSPIEVEDGPVSRQQKYSRFCSNHINLSFVNLQKKISIGLAMIATQRTSIVEQVASTSLDPHLMG